MYIMNIYSNSQQADDALMRLPTLHSKDVVSAQTCPGAGWAMVVVSAIGVAVGGVFCREDIVSAQTGPGAGWAVVGISNSTTK